MPDVNAGPAARFAAALLDLKLSAGDPSYDRMRMQLRAAASKSALSAAARGRTLPSVKGPFTDSESVKGPFTDLRSLRMAPHTDFAGTLGRAPRQR
ncbi:hypothetical protein ATK36_1646 [Amycolatopsis sulphurea]|uniref:Uncharacterized protein n=1 Tax=Amycolatopsis sulphurea TaxID=76022 RepID=A0A2A9F8A1_9PSEU|nr:hypothetical protein ATK36_1646 [Amycolatopsis sulphurea]